MITELEQKELVKIFFDTVIHDNIALKASTVAKEIFLKRNQINGNKYDFSSPECLEIRELSANQEKFDSHFIYIPVEFVGRSFLGEMNIDYAMEKLCKSIKSLTQQPVTIYWLKIEQINNNQSFTLIPSKIFANGSI